MTDFYQRFETRADRTNWVLLGIGIVAVGLLHSVRAGASLALGGVISWVNFHWLKQAVDHLVARGGARPAGHRILIQYAARYALIGGALFATIRFTILDLTFLLAGLFSYILAILLECVFEIARTLLRIDSNGRA